MRVPINNEPNNTAALREASEKIKSLTAQLEECRAELNYMRGRLESVKEIAVLEYRLSRAEKRQSKTENTTPRNPYKSLWPNKTGWERNKRSVPRSNAYA